MARAFRNAIENQGRTGESTRRCSFGAAAHLAGRAAPHPDRPLFFALRGPCRRARRLVQVKSQCSWTCRTSARLKLAAIGRRGRNDASWGRLDSFAPPSLRRGNFFRDLEFQHTGHVRGKYRGLPSLPSSPCRQRWRTELVLLQSTIQVPRLVAARLAASGRAARLAAGAQGAIRAPAAAYSGGRDAGGRGGRWPERPRARTDSGLHSARRGRGSTIAVLRLQAALWQSGCISARACRRRGGLQAGEATQRSGDHCPGRA